MSSRRATPAFGGAPPGTLGGPAIGFKPGYGPRVSTGGFVKLTPEKLAEIRRNGQVIDPITMEELQYQGEFFEVERPDDAPESTPHTYHDPEKLWEWMRQERSRGRLATNRQPIWYEDWQALFFNYGPPSDDWVEPSWVKDLPRKHKKARRTTQGAGSSSMGLERLRISDTPPTGPVEVWGRLWLPGHVSTGTLNLIMRPEIMWFGDDPDTSQSQPSVELGMRQGLLRYARTAGLLNLTESLINQMVVRTQWFSGRGNATHTLVRFGIPNLGGATAQILVQHARSMPNFTQVCFGFGGPPKVGDANYMRITTENAFYNEETADNSMPYLRPVQMDDLAQSMWVTQWTNVPRVAGQFFIPGSERMHNGIRLGMHNAFQTFMSNQPTIASGSSGPWSGEGWGRRCRIYVYDLQPWDGNDLARVTYEVLGLTMEQVGRFMQLTQSEGFSYRTMFGLYAEPISRQPRLLLRDHDRLPDAPPSFTGNAYRDWFIAWADSMSTGMRTPFGPNPATPLILVGRFWVPEDNTIWFPGMEHLMKQGFHNTMNQNFGAIFGSEAVPNVGGIQWQDYVRVHSMNQRTPTTTQRGQPAATERPYVQVSYTLYNFSGVQLRQLHAWMHRHSPSGTGFVPAIDIQTFFNLPADPLVSTADDPQILVYRSRLIEARPVIQYEKEWMDWAQRWAPAKGTMHLNVPQPTRDPEPSSNHPVFRSL
tara:strand:+ start:225 stop:2345 length:2121 start_codon:yes stop_codon:yes gene_type:complete